ncbi:MAG: FAD-binding protein [Nitriliruptoraceae bacterium]
MPAEADVTADVLTCDVLIVGAGAAGLYAALMLPHGLDIVVADKGNPSGQQGSSPWAQGGFAAALGPDDSPQRHVADTVAAGDGLVDEAAARVLANEIGGHVDRLRQLGANFDVDNAGHLELAREGGQHVARSVKRADATGAELIRALRAAAAPRVRRLAGIVTALGGNGRIDRADVNTGGRTVQVVAGCVILATGGCGGLYAATTNPNGATADGLSLAINAGVAVRDVEFVQFHPTAMATSSTRRFLLTEALRGAGATLHDKHGDRFMLAEHPDAELAPRHVVAHAIMQQPEGLAYLDATMLGSDRLTHEFPSAVAFAGQQGFDMASQRVPVSPAAHYHMGGVRTDLWTRTSRPGLLACGEVASTGVHGANRMAGNSLSEALVFGARAATAAVEDLVTPTTTAMSRRGDDAASWMTSGEPSGPPMPVTRAALRQRMLEDVGPVRHENRLRSFVADVTSWLHACRQQPWMATPQTVELHHAFVASRAIAISALRRTESRGGHQRADHPYRDPEWDGIHLEIVQPYPPAL